MSNTKTRFIFTMVWLTVVLATVLIRLPNVWVSQPEAHVPVVATAPASAPVAPAAAPAAVAPEDSAVRLKADTTRSATSAPSFAITNTPARSGGGAARSSRTPAPEIATPVEAAAPGAPVANPIPYERPVADRLVVAAQEATAAGDHTAAIDHLRRLSQERPLTLDESKWLAGQYDAAGNDSEALIGYYAIAQQVGDDPATWERIGDLELKNGRPAAAVVAYSRLAPARRAPAVSVNLARAAAADGQHDAALAAYQMALAGNPAERAAISLEAARYAASIHEPVRALEFYNRYATSEQGIAGLHLEMAQAALAAGRPEEALRWTTAAGTVGNRSVEIRYAQAQALHMTGRPNAAADLLRELQTEKPDDPRFVAWLARTSQAQGRHLEAYELFSEALTAAPAADLLISRGDVAAQRGDTSRARADYAQARAVGAEEELVRERIDRLELTPQVALPFEHLRDSNGVRLTAQTARVDLWTTGPFRLAARWLAGRVEQQTTSFATRSGAVDIDNWFLTPRLSLNGSAGFADVGSSTMPVWNGTARYSWRSGGSIALQTTRQTPWSGDPSREMMRFNRIHDLAGVGPRFDATAFGTQFNLPFSARQGIRADIFAREYSDGNASHDLFVQFQQVVANGPNNWVALQPHLYVEQWRNSSAAYYSPDNHVTTGLTLRAIAQHGIWSFDTALTPQLLTSNARTGFGASVAAGVRARVGGASIGGNVMLFDDRRYAYGLRRFVADVKIPLGQ